MNHLWSSPERYPHKTEQECERCQLVWVRRHEFEGNRPKHWNEFWRDGERLPGNRRPKCVAVEARAA